LLVKGRRRGFGGINPPHSVKLPGNRESTENREHGGPTATAARLAAGCPPETPVGTEMPVGQQLHSKKKFVETEI
jgi:hypothetical protein